MRSIIRAFPRASRRRPICTATCCRCRPRTVGAAEALRCYCAPSLRAPRRTTVRHMRTGSIFRPGYGLVNRPTPPSEAAPYRTACYDRATNRYYMIRQYLHGSGNLDYLDGADWTWKTVGIGRPAADGDNKSAFIDDSRRLLIMQTSTGRLRALDLNDLRSGPVTLRTEGSLPPGNQSQWHLYPADGCWYTYMGFGENTIYKIQPPTTNPLTETWTVSTVEIGGASLPSQAGRSD